VNLSFAPIMISNILSGTALSNTATVAAAAGSKGLKPVALSVVPYALAAVVSLLVALSAQRRQEHFFHAAGTITCAGVLAMLLPVVLPASSVVGFIFLALSMAFASATSPPMMVLAARVCLGGDAAVALPAVNTAVVLGGIIGPPIVGAMLNKLVGGGAGGRGAGTAGRGQPACRGWWEGAEAGLQGACLLVRLARPAPVAIAACSTSRRCPSRLQLPRAASPTFS
jgi:hypothetical protein